VLLLLLVGPRAGATGWIGPSSPGRLGAASRGSALKGTGLRFALDSAFRPGHGAPPLRFEMAFERQLSCVRRLAGPGVPLDEPDRDHDERTQGPRFSRGGAVAEPSAAARRSRYNGHPSRPRNSSAEATTRDDGGHRQASFNGHQ
jgi:hypothetical protein